MLESVPSSSRRDALAEILRSNGTIEIGTAAKEFDVHAMTIRRDLEHLERTGRARRVRGGAVSVEEHFDVRAAQMVGAKRKIAGKLAALIPNTGAICVDASTTALQVVFEMRDANGLSVITNGLATFDALQQVPGVHAYLSGGEADSNNLALIGPLAVAAIERFLVSDAILSSTGIDSVFGTTEPTSDEAAVKHAMASVASVVTLAVDSSKLNVRSVVRSLSLSEVDRLVTELSPSDKRLDPFRKYVEIV